MFCARLYRRNYRILRGGVVHYPAENLPPPPERPPNNIPAHLDHGVVPLLLVLAPVEHVGAEGHEHAAEEGVEQVHLPDHVDEVQEVAHKVLEGVEVVKVESLADVADENLK